MGSASLNFFAMVMVFQDFCQVLGQNLTVWQRKKVK